jgi:threonine dehydrogenase-like Zn-dependent dehydrogenase
MVCRDEVAEPVPGPRQVLVSVRACGICGSDLHFAKHGDELLSLMGQLEGMPKGNVAVDLSNDVFMGHEFSAEVLEAGPDTDAPAAGTLVTSVPVLVSATGFDTLGYSNTLPCGYAERMLLSSSRRRCARLRRAKSTSHP